MSYREITVCLEDEKSVKSLALLANKVGAGLHAYVNGVHVLPIYQLPGIDLAYVPAEIKNQLRERAQSTATAVKSEYERIMSQGDTNWQWIQIQGESFAEFQPYLNYALHSDLVITAQPVTGMVGHALQRRLLMDVGTPLIIAPVSDTNTTFGKRIAVAWNNTAESSRAVRDAMPLLRSADEVLVVSIGNSKNYTGDADPGGITLIDYLEHHNVTPTCHVIEGVHVNVSDLLLDFASTNSVDLLVMGGFGHSRLYDVVFGAATGEVIKNMHIPVFLSH